MAIKDWSSTLLLMPLFDTEAAPSLSFDVCQASSALLLLTPLPLLPLLPLSLLPDEEADMFLLSCGICSLLSTRSGRWRSLMT